MTTASTWLNLTASSVHTETCHILIIANFLFGNLELVALSTSCNVTMKARIPETRWGTSTCTDLVRRSASSARKRTEADGAASCAARLYTRLSLNALTSSRSPLVPLTLKPYRPPHVVSTHSRCHRVPHVIRLRLTRNERAKERERERNEGRCVATQSGATRERRRYETSRSLLSVGSVVAERTGAERRARSPHHTAHHQLARTLARNNSKFEARWRPQRRRPHPRTSRSPWAKRSSWPSNPRCPTSSWFPSSTAPSASKVRSSTPPRGKIKEGKERWGKELVDPSVFFSFYYPLLFSENHCSIVKNNARFVGRRLREIPREKKGSCAIYEAQGFRRFRRERSWRLGDSSIWRSSGSDFAKEWR